MKAELQNVNVKLFERIMKAILEEPKRMNMSIWLKTHLAKAKVEADVKRQLESHDELFGDLRVIAKQLDIGLPNCGTVGCIAGWACALNEHTGKPIRRPDYDWYKATEKLGLTDEQAENLYYPDSWPKQYWSRLEKYEPGTTGYAKTVVARMKYFLRTGK